MKLMFLGAGNMAQAMIRGLLAAGTLTAGEIACVNARNPSHAQETAAALGVEAAEPAALAGADAVVFAMKPQDFAAAAEMYRPYLRAGQLIISIMAGVSFAKLARALGELPAVRVMPNMGIGVRMGVSGYVAGAGASEEQAALVGRLFSALGTAIRLDSEADIAKIIGVAGSSPAYFCLLLEALAAAAEAGGMAAEAAASAARETFIGTAELLKTQPELTAAELRRRISSKKGTTEAAIDAMRAAGFSEAVRAGYDRAVEKSDAMTAQFDAQE